MRTISCAVLAAAVTAASVAAWPVAQTHPDPVELLRRIARLYSEASSGQFEGYTMRAPEGTPPSSTRRRLFGYRFEDPGKLRQDSPGPPVPLMMSDGRTTWVFRSDYQQYRELPGRAFTMPAIDRIRGAAERVRSAQLAGEDVLAVTGRPPTEVWIVDAEYDVDPDAYGMRSAVRFWIGKDRPLVWQERSALGISENAPGSGRRAVQTTVYTKVELNADLPDELFVFTPTPGSMQVERFQDPRSFDLTGRPAPDFALREMEGPEFTLTGQDGKVVLLDFWATWCMPCRMEMPILQGLHEELASRGLMVVGITRGNTSEIRTFLDAHGITFPVLIDDTSDVTKAYLVNGIPVGVIIDAQGKVSSYFPGLRSEQEWREGLERAGLRE